MALKRKMWFWLLLLLILIPYILWRGALRRSNQPIPERPPFEYTVRAKGYKARTITINPKASPSEVVLEDGSPLHGYVDSESGDALMNARVHIDGSGEAVTDSSGRFTLPTPSVSDIRVTVKKEGFQEQRVNFSYEDVRSEIAIHLKQAEGGVYGRVIDSNGKPISNFKITIWASRQAIRYERHFDTDDGCFLITDLPPGTYEFTIEFQPKPSAPIRMMMIPKVEIKKGYFFGEMLVRFPPA